MKKIFLFVFVTTILTTFSQKINKAESTINYIQLPLKPLAKDIKLINATVEMTYKEDIDKRLEEAEVELKEKQDRHAQKVIDAKTAYDERIARYEKNMEEWKKTDLGTKFVEKQILKEDNKPRKPGAFYPPAEPTLRRVVHQKLFNADELSRSYLLIDGFKAGSENALKISVILHGFDSQESDPVTKTSKKYNSSTKQYSNVTTTTYPVSYKHPVSLKIETPSGEILHEGTFGNTDDWQKTFDNTYPNEVYYTRLQEQTINSTMAKLKLYLNNNYGFLESKKVITIFSPSSKKFDYSDFQEAYFDASEGYELLLENEAKGIEKLQKAIKIWEKAIEESDVDNRKARINEKVTKFTYLNLYNAYLWANEFEKSKNAMKRAYGTSPTKKELKALKHARNFINDKEERFKANS